MTDTARDDVAPTTLPDHSRLRIPAGLRLLARPATPTIRHDRR
jgi:hypothetical protein